MNKTTESLKSSFEDMLSKVSLLFLAPVSCNSREKGIWLEIPLNPQSFVGTHCLKMTQIVAFEFWHFPPIFVLLKVTCLVTLYDQKSLKMIFWILAFFTNFCPIKTDLSGNTVWPQASGFQKLAKMDHFWHF